MTKQCARCSEKECYTGKDCFGIADEARKKYDNDDITSMRISGDIETNHYMKITRQEEIIEYAEQMKMKKIGIAFCIGLSREAEIVDRIFLEKGFPVDSACCKICGIDKSELPNGEVA